MFNKMTDDRLKEIYASEKAKQSPDMHILISVASEMRHRDRGNLAEQARAVQQQAMRDVGASMQANIRRAAETKTLFIPVVKE